MLTTNIGGSLHQIQVQVSVQIKIMKMMNSDKSDNRLILILMSPGVNFAWTVVSNKMQTQFVVEKENKTKSSSLVKSVICKIDPDNDAYMIKILPKLYFPEIFCESLTSRHTKLYSGLDSSIWPEHACVSRLLYLRKRRRSSQYSCDVWSYSNHTECTKYHECGK